MAPAKKYAGHWKRPFTVVYGDNYDYGFHSYKDVMHWLDGKEQGVEKAAPKISGLEEYADQHLRYRYGRTLAKDLAETAAPIDDDTDAISRRLQSLKRASEALDRKGSQLRRSKTVGAFTVKAVKEIEDDLRLEASASLDDHLERRQWQQRYGGPSPLNFNHDSHVQFLDGRRRKIDNEFSTTTTMYDSQDKETPFRFEDSIRTMKIISETEEEREESSDAMGLVKDVTTNRRRRDEYEGGNARVWESRCKTMQIELEQMNARLVEAETKLKTEVQRIKKKFQIQITELEMSLDVANKNNIELQKTIKRQAIQITELQNHYDELQRQLQTTLDQYAVAQRRVQALQAELDEMRANIDAAMRAKRQAEQLYEEAHVRVTELTTINMNISAAKSKLEGELSAFQADYDEISKELRLADERATKAQAELKHTTEILHEEQERVVKIESIRKSLEIEVKNLQIRLEEVETNALVGGKRVISKLEARIRDIETELDEEKRRHAETIKLLRKKERQVKEIIIQSEDYSKNVSLLTDQVEKLSEKAKMYKRQLQEQEGMSQSNLTRVRRFQRELEAAEERAESAEGNLNFIRHKHRSWVTSNQTPAGGATKQIYVVEEHRHENF